MKQLRNAFGTLNLLLLTSILLAACGTQAPTAVAQPTSAPTAVAPPTAAPPTAIPATATAQPAATAEPTATARPPTTAPTQAPTVVPASATQAVLPDCSKGVTPAQTEGPYYKANTPERASLLEPGMTGTKVIVTGYVLTADCKPIARALLDFWQADDKGAYDNTGYRLRGHLFTDASGRYTLETILPGLYPGRTRHIHVKVQAPNQPALTTQLYFPEDQQRNSADGIYSPQLLVTWQTSASAKTAVFNFVLNVR